MDEGASTEDAMRGFAHLAGMIKGVGFSAQVIHDAQLLGDFRNQMRAAGIENWKVRRVLDQEMHRTGPITMDDRLMSARTRLLSGPPYDSTNQRFEEIVSRAEVLGRNPGDAHHDMLSLYDLGMFLPEVAQAMRESDINEQD